MKAVELFRPLPPRIQKIFNIFAFVVCAIGGWIGGMILSLSPGVTAENVAGGILLGGFIWLVGFFCGKTSGAQKVGDTVLAKPDTRLGGMHS